jgi:hypothetical protein
MPVFQSQQSLETGSVLPCGAHTVVPLRARRVCPDASAQLVEPLLCACAAPAAIITEPMIAPAASLACVPLRVLVTLFIVPSPRATHTDGRRRREERHGARDALSAHGRGIMIAVASSPDFASEGSPTADRRLAWNSPWWWVADRGAPKRRPV